MYDTGFLTVTFPLFHSSTSRYQHRFCASLFSSSLSLFSKQLFLSAEQPHATLWMSSRRSIKMCAGVPILKEVSHLLPLYGSSGQQCLWSVWSSGFVGLWVQPGSDRWIFNLCSHRELDEPVHTNYSVFYLILIYWVWAFGLNHWPRVLVWNWL